MTWYLKKSTKFAEEADKWGRSWKKNIQDTYLERSQWGVWTFGNFYANEWCQWFNLFMAMEFASASPVKRGHRFPLKWQVNRTVWEPCSSVSCWGGPPGSNYQPYVRSLSPWLPHQNLKDTHIQIKKQLSTVSAIPQQYASKFWVDEKSMWLLFASICVA